MRRREKRARELLRTFYREFFLQLCKARFCRRHRAATTLRAFALSVQQSNAFQRAISTFRNFGVYENDLVLSEVSSCFLMSESACMSTKGGTTRRNKLSVYYAVGLLFFLQKGECGQVDRCICVIVYVCIAPDSVSLSVCLFLMIVV